MARVSPLSHTWSLALALVPLASFAGASAAATPSPQSRIMPLIYVERETSADQAFIRKATALAIAGMTAAQHEIAVAQTVNVQDEALRSFNTAAAEYNGLADIASKRRMKIAKPSSFIVDDTPSLAQDARPGPGDFKYVGAYQASLGAMIDLYHAEIQHGKDPLAVSFATKMRPRIVHDLDLVTVDIENLNRPVAVPTAPAAAGPDPGSSVPASSPSP